MALLKATLKLRNRGALALCSYFLLSLLLTLLNKFFLQEIKSPYLLTALHSFASWLGCAVLLKGSSSTARMWNLPLIDHVKLVVFSILYSLNIGISNVSLHLVSISLHQLLRATTPAITALLLYLLSHKRYTPTAYISVALVVLGVILATTPQKQKGKSASPYSASTSGVFVTLLGTFLASLKSIITSALQKPKSNTTRFKIGLGLGGSELIHYVSLFAFLQSIICAYGVGEFNHLRGIDITLVGVLPINCLIAFALNIASFETNRIFGALGITIAGNAKQVLIVGLGCVLGQNERLEWWRWIGVLGTACGTCWFVIEERGMKLAKGLGMTARKKGLEREVEEGVLDE